MACDVKLQNTGNVGLSSLRLSSTADGSSLSCPDVSALIPQQNRTCTLSKAVHQVRVCS